MSSVEDQGQTDRVTATLTLTFSPRRAMVITHTQTQVERSVGSKDRMETNGHMEGQIDVIDCFTFPANAVGKY